jgi:molybdenum cofactor guanylyltransferase
VSTDPAPMPSPAPPPAQAAELPPYDAVVLAGGEGRRFGGQDKPALLLGGRTLVARVVEAVADAETVVLVGPRRPGVRADVTTREHPVGAGPVAAVGAGVAHVRSGHVAVLAGDLPFLTSEVLTALRRRLAAQTSLDVALAVDDRGQDQLLLAVWRTPALRDVLASLEPLPGVPVWRLVGQARAARCVVPAQEGSAPAWFDCDTPSDLHRAKGWT